MLATTVPWYRGGTRYLRYHGTCYLILRLHAHLMAIYTVPAENRLSVQDAGMLPPPSKRSRRGAAQRVLAYMDALPCAAQYETSYAHRAVVTHTVVAARAHIKIIREK